MTSERADIRTDGPLRDGRSSARRPAPAPGDREPPTGLATKDSPDTNDAPTELPGAPSPGRRSRLVVLLKSGGARRARWGVADQAISSLTNFTVVATAAHVADPREFGAFSVAITVYIFVLWVARSLIAEPFVVRFTAEGDERQVEAGRQAVGTAVALASVSAVALMAVGAAIGGTQGAALAVVALGLPGLLAQDTYRYLMMAAGRTRSAALNDGLWFAVQSAVVLALVLAEKASVTTLLVGFGAGGTVAAILGWRQTGVAPRVSSWKRWFGTHRDLSVPFVLELVAVNGMTQVALLGVAAVAGVVAVGQLRAATLLLSPVSVLFAGAFLVAVPEAVRVRQRSPQALVPTVLGLAAVTCFITVLWGAALLLLPSRAGRAVLGSNWASARHVLVPVIVLTTANCAVLSIVVGLRALAAARDSLRVRIWAAPIILLGALAGAGIGDAYGAGVALALASWASAGLAWVAFDRSLKREHRPLPS